MQRTTELEELLTVEKKKKVDEDEFLINYFHLKLAWTISTADKFSMT